MVNARQGRIMNTQRIRTAVGWMLATALATTLLATPVALAANALAASPASTVAKSGTKAPVAAKVKKSATKITASASLKTISFDGTTTITGQVTGLKRDAEVVIKGRGFDGGATVVLARVPVKQSGEFSAVIGNLGRNTHVTVAFAGDDLTRASSKRLDIKVRALVSLTVTLSKATDGEDVLSCDYSWTYYGRSATFVLEYQPGGKGKWLPEGGSGGVSNPDQPIGAPNVGSARTWWVGGSAIPSGMNRVRVRFTKIGANVPTTSNVVTVVVP
jgi:hypothetical protein